MDHLAPLGDVYQAGTLSGNPLAVAAGLSMMNLIESYNVYELAERQTQTLVQGLSNAIQESSVPAKVVHMGTMFTVFFTNHSIKNVHDVNQCDMNMLNRYFHHMKAHNILIPPSQYEANFVSSEHNDEIIEATIHAFQLFLNDNDNQS